ncbi:O-methyltransferase [Flavobacterium flavigenum]|uniref:O-methyltransferase n=1 Tax=Flavobacterium flavigenum TaxID=3003258 RepID=UPI0022AC541E|nr:class I SAM-dependent methyltransferase [Flavobacterium flavigenum]
MLFQIKSYLKFLWHSKNEHGVHSPFVFSLLTKCFYDKKPKPEYSILNNYRKSLLENKNFIDVTDFGAGSKVFKSTRRQISKIAQTAGISPKRAELLFRVTNYFKPKNVLEIGTSLGLASSSIALGSKESFLLSLEGCQNTQSVAENLFNKQFPDFNFEFVNSEFSKFLKDGLANSCDWNLIYFDGNHSKKATLEYFDLLLPTIDNDSVWVFDDIHWSSEMEEAWETIKKHPKVKVTIDTFQWGFVFFRHEQEKEHFIIRA